MPNYVTNIVSFDGPHEQVDKLLDRIAFDGHPGTFDFNKVIPMPKGLDLTEGSITDDAIDAYLSFARPGSKSRLSLDERLSSAEFQSILIGARNIRPFYTPNFLLTDQRIAELADVHRMIAPEDLVRLGKRYMDNFREHGAPTWYGWSTQKWGTKWNNDPEQRVIDDETGNLHFDTAWSMPEPVFVELSRQFPELTLEVRWADEDYGYNLGTRQYRNGECIDEYLPEQGSAEAMSMAFEIKGMGAAEIAEDYPELTEEYPDLFQPAEDMKAYAPSNKQLELDVDLLNEQKADFLALDNIKQEAKERAQEKQQSPKDKVHEAKRAEPER